VLEASLKAENAQLAELTKNVKTAEARAADAEKRAEKAVAAQEAADKKRTEAEATPEGPSGGKEPAEADSGAQHRAGGHSGDAGGLTKERDEASQFVTRLNVTTDNQNKKLAELQQQITPARRSASKCAKSA
jgi:hypothetical protein